MLVVGQASHIYKAAIQTANQVNCTYLFSMLAIGIPVVKPFLSDKLLAIFAFSIAEIAIWG